MANKERFLMSNLEEEKMLDFLLDQDPEERMVITLDSRQQ